MKARVIDVRRDRVNDKKRGSGFHRAMKARSIQVNSVSINGDEDFPTGGNHAGHPPQGAASRIPARMWPTTRNSSATTTARKGYADARVDTIINPAGENAVDVVYSVVEGGKSFVGKVNISGNVKTKDKVVRREVTLAPGDVFNTVELDATRKRLQNTGYYQQVDVCRRIREPGTAT